MVFIQVRLDSREEIHQVCPSGDDIELLCLKSFGGQKCCVIVAGFERIRDIYELINAIEKKS